MSADRNNARNQPGAGVRECVARCETLQDLDDLERIFRNRSRYASDVTKNYIAQLLADRRAALSAAAAPCAPCS